MSGKTTTDRRSFLKLAGIGAAGAIAATAGAQSASAEAPQDGDAVYRETDHVRKVYELSRF
ncbi:MAG TPA: twin-arginine translocation signal domain-containing protein [Rhizobiales bacterium]|nr:twin-arginine translocation signal domain-containing protein [Hyphomicrobiales bacterium]